MRGLAARWAAVLLAVVWLAAADGAPRAWAGVIRLEDEVRLGRDASGEFERSSPLCTDPAINARVRRIGQRLAAVSDRKGITYQFKVVDTADLNALAFPGGFVYVYRGLVDVMPSDDALAAIIGHEIAHDARRHWARGSEKDMLANLATVPFAGTLLGSLGGLVGRQLLALGHSRSAENEADRVGMAYLVAAGYDPRGAVEAWETMIRLSKPEKRRLRLLRTHPYDQERLENLRKLAEAARRAAASPNPSGGPPSGTPGQDAAAGARSAAARTPAESLAGPGASAAAKREQTPAPRVEAPPLGPGAPDGLGKPLKGRAAELLPLGDGARWTYRVRAESGRDAAASLEVAGAVPGRPGVYTGALSLPEGVDLRCWLALGAEGLWIRLSPEDPDSPWRLEAALPKGTAEEEVVVPAGRFQALRVEVGEQPGRPRVTLWVAPGVGIVKRRIEGVWTEELESHRAARAASGGAGR